MRRSHDPPRSQPCLARVDGRVCFGVLWQVAAREWRCTEGHTMWGTANVLRSEPWPADRPHVPWFARLRARIFGRSKSAHNGGSGL